MDQYNIQVCHIMFENKLTHKMKEVTGGFNQENVVFGVSTHVEKCQYKAGTCS